MSDLILFVEDNIDLRDSAAHLLELNGFEVWVAGDGREGLEILQKDSRVPDLIVSDISMPHMNGYDFFTAVKNQSHLKGVPFIFLTALGARSDIRLGWEIGVDDYLVKPFQPEDFLAAVRNRLKRNREIRQIADQQLNETRHMLVRILSHELRTPLTYVTGGFTLLADEINKQQEMQENSHDREEVETILDLIRSGTSRLTRLAEQTVLLSELMSGQYQQHLVKSAQYVEISSLIQAALSQMQTFAMEKQATFHVKDMPALKVHGLVPLFITAIYEVVHNAIQHSAPGNTVTIHAYREDNMVTVEIEDQGRGIADKDMKLIWDLISQSQRDRFEQQGFGLGLPITKNIMEVHGGRVDIKSQINVGTTVYLRFPVEPMFTPPA